MINVFRGLTPFLFFLGTIFGAFLSPQRVAAASCSNFDVKVDGSTVTVSADGCSPNGSYIARIFQGGDVKIASNLIPVTNGNFQTTFHIEEVGEYEAVLYFGFAEEVARESFSVSSSEPLQCGDPANPNDVRCPESCPATRINNQWICYQPPTPTPSQGGGGTGSSGGRSGGGGAPGGGSGGGSGGFGSSSGPFCNDDNGIDTAIGCIPINNISAFASKFLSYLTGIFGAVALVIMAYGSFKITTSAGNQERVKEGKELITSAVSGLLFIIFSMFLLKLIGVEILKLPGLE